MRYVRIILTAGLITFTVINCWKGYDLVQAAKWQAIERAAKAMNAGNERCQRGC